MSLKLLLDDENNLISFYFPSGDIRVNSIYEAMFYAVNFIDKCAFELLSDEFTEWLEKLKGIREKQKNETKAEYIIKIFKELDYLDDKEIRMLKKALNERESAGKFAQFKGKADVYYKKGDYANACSMYFSAFNIEETAEVLNDIGLCFIALDDLKTGLTSIEQAHIMKADDKKISYNLAKAYVLCREYSKALECIKDNEDYESNILKAKINISMDEFEVAVNILNDLYMQSPNDDIVLMLCDIYTKQRCFEKAEEILLKAKESSEKAIMLGNMLMQKLDYKGAIREIEKNLMKYKDNKDLWIALSKYYRISGDYLKAEGAIYKAYTLDKENIEIALEHAKIKYSDMKYNDYKSRINIILEKLKKKYRENEKFLVENI